MVATAEAKRRARRIAARLRREYPIAQTALDHGTPLHLLVATILSAQCTDERVNQVTPGLFRKYPTADHFARARLPELERAIHSTGFFRNKAKNIKAACQALVAEHGGDVPREIEQLVRLPGIGRKTANVVLGSAYGIASGVVVDTHVARLSRRLGLTNHADPVKIERDLVELLPKKEWVAFSHRLIFHGRRVCLARRPKCDECILLPLCPRIGVTSPPTASDRPSKRPVSKRPVSKRPVSKRPASRRARP